MPSLSDFLETTKGHEVPRRKAESEAFVVLRVLCGGRFSRTARALLTADCWSRRAVAVSMQQRALSLWAALVRRLPERYARLEL